MKISEWMQQQKVDDGKAAALFGVSASAIMKWKRGERVPRPDQLVRIYELTEGEVSPNDFVELPIVGKTVSEAAE